MVNDICVQKHLTSSVLADEHMTFLDAKTPGDRYRYCCVQTVERLISKSVYRRSRWALAVMYRWITLRPTI